MRKRSTVVPPPLGTVEGLPSLEELTARVAFLEGQRERDAEWWQALVFQIDKELNEIWEKLDKVYDGAVGYNTTNLLNERLEEVESSLEYLNSDVDDLKAKPVKKRK